MSKLAMRRSIAAAAVAVLIPSLAAAQGGVTQPKQGQGGGVIQGGGWYRRQQAIRVSTCEKPMGAMAVVEPQSEYLASLSAVPALRRRSASFA